MAEKAPQCNLHIQRGTRRGPEPLNSVTPHSQMLSPHDASLGVLLELQPQKQWLQTTALTGLGGLYGFFNKLFQQALRPYFASPGEAPDLGLRISPRI